MIDIGKHVFVRWYGTVLQGEVVHHEKDGSVLDQMVAVRIPLMGCQPVALFTEEHVYGSAEAARGMEAVASKTEAPFKKTEASASGARSSLAWQRVQAFKREHWDEVRGHLKVEALEDYYQMWREGVAWRMKERQAFAGKAKGTAAGIQQKAAGTRRGTAADTAGIAALVAEKRQKRVEAIQLSLF